MTTFFGLSRPWHLVLGVVLAFVVSVTAQAAGQTETTTAAQATFDATVMPLLAKYCLGCHSTAEKKGSLDLQRFVKLDDVRKHVKPWQNMIEQLETSEMPPKDKPQPTEVEKRQLIAWVRTFLETEARARKGDPGHLPLRRLSNAEYDATIRDLTGFDLRPTREFPQDGAGGEGFTNAGESLTDISPALFSRYLQAAKEISDHAVLLPDGFRFSPSKTRRDWTDESTARLRKFYAKLAPGDGKLAAQPYLLATVQHREALSAGKFAEVASDKLNAKYLRILWETLNDTKASQPLDSIRAKWRTATEKDIADLNGEIASWQASLWRTAKVGNYVRGSWGKSPEQGDAFTESLSRQAAFDPPPMESVTVRLPIKSVPGQSDVTIHLAARESAPVGSIVWQRPRFEGTGKPTLLLRDYADFGPAFEADIASAFAKTSAYLSAVVELTHAENVSPETIAARGGLDAAFLKQWAKVLAITPQQGSRKPTPVGAPLTLLENKTPPSNQDAIRGWSRKGADLPVVVANSSERTLQIPGRVSGRTVGVHPTPQEFVAIAWKSPIVGSVVVTSRVAHAHPSCGNGVAWQLEHRRGERATLLGESALDLGQEAKLPAKPLTIEKGDLLVLVVDPRDAEHTCDMTEVELTITEDAAPKRVWDLGKDVSWEIQAANPHADSHGHAGVWNFVRGPARKASGSVAKSAAQLVPVNSALGRWRSAAANLEQEGEAEQLAREVEKVLTGLRPANEKDVERAVYDRFVTADSPLFTGVDLTKITKSNAKRSDLGLPKNRFAEPARDSLLVASNQVVEIRLPAALFAGREFVVDAKLDAAAGSRFVRVQATTAPPDANSRWDGPILTSPDNPEYRKLIAGHEAFRRVFPLFVCFPQVVPSDEVVTLKMFHREDEPLERLFLSPEQIRELNGLWAEQRLISRQPVAEFDYLPQFMGFTTQDTPKSFQQFFIDRKPTFQREAEEFLKLEEAVVPQQLDALAPFVAKAFRRPLQAAERTELQTLYDAVRKKGAAHDEAIRGVLARVLASPSFLFRVELSPPGKEPGLVSDWELATRLSYFLWSSLPDDELRQLAAAGRLRDPQVLAEQTRRMLKDDRTRSLAIEFGTQWIHVRGFDDLKEKNERLFPMFDASLRLAIYEESILFFQDLFRSDQPIANVLDANYTFLNEPLAKHYGIPGVTGTQWRRVDGVRKYGRGGVLGLASVHAKQSGASRTSPVLRGNWVVETLLGEKLPKPPANVPVLPDEEGADKLTTRQRVEKHVSNPSCAACHVRIDPFGFAFESFDPIGRFRLRESSGQPVDTKARVRDGTEFTGVDGLRTYLLTKKKDAITRLFCQRLLGYALGRGTTLSDTTLIDQMVSETNANDGKISAAVLTIVRSPQFRMIRGHDASDE